jgi:DNA-binding transcriptional MocR family regulator
MTQRKSTAIKSRGHPEHKPTEETRRTVAMHVTVGITQERIAKAMGIGLSTLQKHYREELDTAADKANEAVANALFHQATVEKDTTAMIFWMKTRARWRETQEIDIKKETTFVFRGPDKVSDTEEWLNTFGPKSIESTAESPLSGSLNPARKRLS